jgi:hypothetical protein
LINESDCLFPKGINILNSVDRNTTRADKAVSETLKRNCQVRRNKRIDLTREGKLCCSGGSANSSSLSSSKISPYINMIINEPLIVKSYIINVLISLISFVIIFIKT